MIFSKKFILCMIGLLLNVTASAKEVSFSDSPIRIVVAFSPGGPGDLLARRIGEQLSKTLKTPVIVENKTGAGGQIATTTVVGAKADGHTLLLNTGALATEAVTKSHLPYDVTKDLVPVTKAVALPAVIMINSKIPAKNISEFISYAKEHPEAISFGSSGVSSSTHLAGELMKSVAQIKAIHIPYAGGTPMLQALMAGDISYLVAPINLSKQLATSGKVRPLAVTSASRVAYWPEVPTTAEAKYPEIEFTLWFGFFAPSKTSPQIVDTLSSTIRDICQEPAMAKWIFDQGFISINNSSSVFQSELAAEIKRWSKLVQKLDLPKVE